MNELTPVISDAAVTILTAMIALLSAYAMKAINAFAARIRAQTVELEDSQFRSFVDEALARVDDLAAKTVTQLEQTAAKTLREAVKNGTAEQGELRALGKRAVREILASLSGDYREAICETVGDVETYITKAVETKVFELKNSTSIRAIPDGVPV